MKRSPLHRYTPLRRGAWRTHPRPRRPPQRGRSRSYLDWIRSLPCLICGSRAQAAHTGRHGCAVKSPDNSAIPLCAEHHLECFADSYHRLGRTAFEVRYGLNVDAIVASLQYQWRAR